MDPATAIGSAVLIVLVVGLVALLRHIRNTRSVMAGEAFVSTDRPSDVDAALREALAAVKGARVLAPAPGRLQVVLRRAPVWTVLIAWLLFPVGLVALLYKEDVVMDVGVYSGTDGGTQVHLSGSTEAHVLQRVRAATVGVPGLVPASATLVPEAATR